MRLVTFRDSPHSTRVGILENEQVHGLAAETMIEWLNGEGRVRTGVVHPLQDVHLLAPVPVPPSFRDFFSYEEHVAKGFELRGAEIPEAWYEQPVFYFSNPAGIHGPGDEVTRPEGCELLDFELEIAAVIGQDEEIAGFALLNDWSARDFQVKEMSVGLGPAKGKDFATSFGPMIVTPDELPYEDGRLHLEASVTVNNEELTRSDASKQHHSWPDIVAHAARNTELRPGDVIGSGTLGGGCLLELGPIDGSRWLEPGDLVALDAPGLGTLANPVV
ncbi:MAG TPA: fumarylacetoacetate hydrolase family protein [Solirubrobacterales bacterium]|nr:fumarylacetoacetate hydrolase family protein [Solirubrobacterales bacterium]